MSANNTSQPQYDDEIDLIELISKLWQEKLTIIFSTAIATTLGIIYLIVTPSTYQAMIQIEPPTTPELSIINNSQIISKTPETAFADFLQILESDTHKSEFISHQKALLRELFKNQEEDITLEKIDASKLYSINFPTRVKQQSNLKPSIYTISSSGTDRDLIKKLLNNNVELATKSLMQQWKQEYQDIKSAQIEKNTQEYDQLFQAMAEQRENTIIRLTEERQLEIQNLQDELAARKFYVLTQRKDRIIELEEALKIATTLKITKPSTLSQMSRQSSARQVEVITEINNQQEPLYLRGTNLLAAELDNLKNLPNDTLLDNKVLEIESQLEKLKNNREVEILKNRENDTAFNEKLQQLKEKLDQLSITTFPDILPVTFHNTLANAPLKPTAPKKSLSIAISILFGGMIGLLIAAGRIIYRNYKEKRINGD